MPDSLRAQLLRWLLVPLLLMVVIAGVVAYFIIAKPTMDAYDQEMLDSAMALSHHITQQGRFAVLDFPREAEPVLRSDRYDDIYYAVLGSDGRVIGGDSGLPVPPLSPVAASSTAYEGIYRGRPVRAVAIMRNIGEPVTIIVAETTNKRRRVTLKVTIGMLLPELMLALGLVALVWYGVGRGLAPLGRLQSELQARSYRDLRPVDARQVVQEVRPVVSEINQLLHRLKASGEAQRRFIANAAHQLRTPLAGLQTQLELALGETDEEARRRQLEHCLGSTQRTARLVHQLLTLSAAEPGGRSEELTADVPLAEMLQADAYQWVRRSVERDIDFGLELEPAQVLGDRLLLGELVSNLLENAFAYTPSGGQVTLRCGVRGGGAYVSVADSGPGIPVAARQQVLERFYRLPGTPGIGSGLGLAIVREIAQRHGAVLDIGETAGAAHGTTVTVQFPAP